MQIRSYREADQEVVIALWQTCGLTRPWNDPLKDIRRKLGHQRELFLVAEEMGQVVGTAMAGFDGHRGWVYYLAVDREYRSEGIGRSLMEEAERRLLALGCPKINLMIRRDNPGAIRFHAALGYYEDAVITFSKRLIPDS